MKPMILAAIIPLLLIVSGSPATATDEARQAYDQMVDEASREADAYLKEKASEREETQAAAETAEAERLENRVQAERQRIVAEMNDIQQRGLSSTFTQGMKDNLLKTQEEKLDALMSDPEAYFAGP
jgi:rhamnose utilization protein RhaD (predicted bifunctional aldolase and dehydrogenase)